MHGDELVARGRTRLDLDDGISQLATSRPVENRAEARRPLGMSSSRVVVEEACRRAQQERQSYDGTRE
jgi:hypothetical protein